MRRVQRVSPLPIVRLINPNYASPTSAQMVQRRLGDLRRTPRRGSPIATVRRRSCNQQPETPDALSSCDFAFEPAAKGRSPLAGEDERQLLALVRAVEMRNSGSWSAWQVSSRSPENAERSNLHRLLAMRLLELREGNLHLNNSLVLWWARQGSNL
jgi:hypothetical protein